MYCNEELVGISKVGADGKLKLGSILEYLQDCEWHDLILEPDLSVFFKRNNVGMFIVYRQVDILRRPDFGEKLLVKSWAVNATPILGYRNTSICDKDGSICIASFTIGAFVNLESGKPIKVPKEILGSIMLGKKLDMEYLPRKMVNHNAVDEIQKEIKVCKFFIDGYGHVNNAKYVELAEEFIPEGYEVNRIRVEYINPANQFDILVPAVYCLDSGIIGIKLANDAGKEYARVEFA